MKYPTTLLQEIIDLITGVISGGRVLVTATLTGIGDLATQATLALIKAKTDNLDVALSTVATQTTLAALLAAINDYPTFGTPVVVAISDTSAATGSALTAGKYLLYSEVTCGWRQAASPVAVLATDSPLPAGTLVPVTLAATKLAAITAAAEGNLYIIPVS